MRVKPKCQPKVVVALSGGVDSSVAAALLQRQGFDVTAAFMKNWSDSKNPVTGQCAWRGEKADAELVAANLGMPFVVFDFEKEYRRSVVDYLFREYAAGRTPNPDVLCNRSVKFDLFWRAARKLGADFIATGHYARLRRRGGRVELLAGRDRNKDQSYFLHLLTQAQLRRTLFPVGHLTKPQVRALARRYGLHVAAKKDSQGICFIGKIKLKAFLAKRLKPQPGPIITTAGEVIGRHDGLAPFTIGQRHGLGIGGGAPYFVVRKDRRRHALIVARGADDPALYARELAIGRMHWIAGTPPRLPLRCRCRIRYRQPLQSCELRRDRRGHHILRFSRPQRAVTPGQFAVLYAGDVCLGGGVIK